MAESEARTGILNKTYFENLKPIADSAGVVETPVEQICYAADCIAKATASLRLGCDLHSKYKKALFTRVAEEKG